jgi:hypothetical protein
MFDLCQVMRQQDTWFIQIHNQFRKVFQTDKNIDTINKLCLKLTPSIPRFPHLLYINKTIQEHSTKWFEQTIGRIYHFQAKDIKYDTCPPCLILSKIDPSKIGGLHYELHLNSIWDQIC